MNSTFRRTNQLLSVLMVVVGVVLLWRSTGGGVTTNMQGALGVVLVVYGVARYVLWSRYRGRGE